jgi:hypothetical protein
MTLLPQCRKYRRPLFACADVLSLWRGCRSVCGWRRTASQCRRPGRCGWSAARGGRAFCLLGADFPLGTHAAGDYVEHGQQVHLAAISADCAADRLAVRGGLLQQAGRAPSGGHRGEVAIQFRVERLGADMPEDRGEGAGTGRADPPGPRVAPPPSTASVSCGRPLP